MADRSTPRLPSNYRLVLEVLERGSPGVHRSTAQLHDEVRARKPGIGYSTVRRGLQRLCELGLATAVKLPHADSAQYEPAGRRHAHFACDGCGTIVDVEYALSRGVLARLGERHDFAISGETITFSGRCSECRA